MALNDFLEKMALAAQRPRKVTPNRFANDPDIVDVGGSGVVHPIAQPPQRRIMPPVGTDWVQPDLLSADRFQLDAQAQASPANPPAQIQDWERVLTQPSAPPPQITQHSGGIGSRLKDALVGFATMGPLGAIASAINPQLAHNARFNLIDLPRYQKQAALESDLQSERVGRLRGLADMLGRIPGTQEPTEAAKYRQSTLDYKQAVEAWNQKYQAERLQQQDEALAQRKTIADMLEQGRMTRKQMDAMAGSQKLFANRMFSQWGLGQLELGPSERAFLKSITNDPNAQAYIDQLPAKAPEAFGYQLVFGPNGEVQSVPMPRATHSPQGPSVIPGVQAKPQRDPEDRARYENQIKSAVSNEWLGGGKTSTGKPIVNGRVVDPAVKLTSDEEKQIVKSVILSGVVYGSPEFNAAVQAERTRILSERGIPLEDHPDYKREVTRRLGEAEKPGVTTSKIPEGKVRMLRDGTKVLDLGVDPTTGKRIVKKVQ